MKRLRHDSTENTAYPELPTPRLGGGGTFGTAVALIGLPASGKTTVGKLLADISGWTFVDLDSRIVEAADLDIPSIFAREGEAGFRVHETRALGQVVAEFNLEPCRPTAPGVTSMTGRGTGTAGTGTPFRLVLATGGGIVLSESNRRMLADFFIVVWLRLSPEEAACRISGSGRPLLSGLDPFARLRELDSQRAALYSSIATMVVDVGSIDASVVAEKIREEIFSR